MGWKLPDVYSEHDKINYLHIVKILFAIQGTGNGHLSRARDVYPLLTPYGDVDVLISGIQADVDVPFPVKYKYYGLSFIFGKTGGVDISETLKKARLLELVKDVRRFPVEQYDLVINDFEHISAWACRRKNKPCISLSHQYAVIQPGAPKPDKTDPIGELALNKYVPVTAGYGFHFKAFAPHVYTPVIRKEIRQLKPTTEGHYTVYLPAYDDETLVKHLSQFDVPWHVFSKHNKEPRTVGNVHLKKIDNQEFVKSMASSTGVLIGGGFEGPAEAMYLGKKLMVIPMTGQYEQQCNALGAKAMGASMIPLLDQKYHPEIEEWVKNGQPVKVDYPDITADIIAELMRDHAGK